jgi:ubiquinone/menaquinone biosynthesis C-methylase UbiE
MKVRDSGMPEEEMWSTFFDPISMLQQIEITTDLQSVVDLGCGFGTFSIPASQIINGKVHAFDIEEEMILQLSNKCNKGNITNIELYQKDFIAEGTGFPNESTDYVMLFNILHHDNPHQILREVRRILKPGAKAGIVHWRSDIETPRGPQLHIRPTSEQCKRWASDSSFTIQKELILEPYHFGLIIRKL